MTPAERIAEYQRGPELLRQAVSGLTAEEIRARPVPGKWSTLEVVCHLADFDPILADRLKRIIALDKPLLMGADENRFAAALCPQDRDLEEELRLIELTRSQMARILAKLPADAWSRTGIHSERGELNLERVLELATRHITHHLAFIAEKRKALGRPA
ncbi:MAG TPA: DinB family protein [Gemmatales bacterium]|nr:DinB family protein [Gemmatales bacterium]HMP61237.1 DinB family protein [Gemmatales bacterium]